MSTRSAAKQQELEEQFSSILAFMKELKANQNEHKPGAMRSGRQKYLMSCAPQLSGTRSNWLDLLVTMRRDWTL